MLKWIFSFLLLSVVAFAQTSALTATITDSDSQTWNNGTYTITFVPPTNVPANQTVWNGSSTFTKSFSGSMNGSGAISASIADNSFINPSGSKWQFIICPNASSTCSTVVLSVTGASPSLSSSLSAAAVAPRFSSGPNSYGYLDVEVGTPASPLFPGASYYNVTTQSQKVWNGTAWTSPSLPLASMILTSVFTNLTTSFSGADIPGLSFPVAANLSYNVTCLITWQGSATTTGPKFQWTGPASPTYVTQSMHSPVTTTTYIDAVGSTSAFSSAMANTGTITAATNFTATVILGFNNGPNAGTVSLQAAANGAGTLTIQPGSSCK